MREESREGLNKTTQIGRESPAELAVVGESAHSVPEAWAVLGACVQKAGHWS